MVPIRLRLAVLCTLLVVVVLAIGGVLFTNVLRADLLDELDGELSARADSTVSALRAGAPPEAEASQVVGPQDLFLQITDAAGQVVAASGAVVASTVLTPAQLRAAAETGVPIDRTLAAGSDGDAGDDSLRLLVVQGQTPGGGFVVVGATLVVVGASVVVVAGAVVLVVGWLAPKAARPLGVPRPVGPSNPAIALHRYVPQPPLLPATTSLSEAAWA